MSETVAEGERTAREVGVGLRLPRLLGPFAIAKFWKGLNMLKKLMIWVVLYHTMMSIAMAGPFGIEMGDTVAPENISDAGLIYEDIPWDGKGGFDSVTKYGVEETGVCKVGAIKLIDSNRCGDSVKSAFSDVAEIITAKYGSPSNEFDYLRHGSIWDENRDWMMGLAVGKERSSIFGHYPHPLIISEEYSWSHTDSTAILRL